MSLKVGLLLFFLLQVFLSFPGIIQASDDRELYSQAVENAREGNEDFAFMYFKDILKRYPDSPYIGAAAFACGEYYYQIADYDDALRIFGQLEASSANPKETLFVLMYLFKIAEIKKEEALIERLKNGNSSAFRSKLVIARSDSDETISKLDCFALRARNDPPTSTSKS